MIRYILIMLLGCVPLAVLTGTSFLELRSTGQKSVGAAAAFDPPPESPTGQIESQVQAAKPLVQTLCDGDFWATESLRGLDDVAGQSEWKSLKESWTRWVAARQLVRRSLNIPVNAKTGSPEQLQDVVAKLEQLRSEYERSKPDGSEAVVAVLDRRANAIREQIRQAQRKAEADALFFQARSAFQPAQYAQCASQCDLWLAKYSDVDAALATAVKQLRDNAQFKHELEQFSKRWKADKSLTARKPILEEFLAKYEGRASHSSEEHKTVAKCREWLSWIEDELRKEEQNRRAEEAVRRLRDNPPPELASRLQAALQVRQMFGSSQEVVRLLREVGAEWLAELLPDKHLQEPANLQEVETKDGHILRGYFREVKTPNGNAYQFYSTRQATSHPGTQVGAYERSQLLGPPGPSVPRQCVVQYGKLRKDVIWQPWRKAGWVQLAEACEGFDAKLAEYRRKPGSSQEPLGFAAEASRAREILSDPVWINMEKLFGR